jgi:hypothetical protein
MHAVLTPVRFQTRTVPSSLATAAAPNRNIVSTVVCLLGELMYAIQVDLDIACRTVGRCTFGAHLGRELMDLVPKENAVS